MRTVRPTAPAWVKLALVVVFVGGPGWWLAQRHDRVGNESRLSAIASTIAGRDVRVRCPGVVGRVLSWDTVEGSVRFDAAGRPADETRLRAFTCAELDALAEGRRASAATCADAACAPGADLASGYPRLPERYRSGACVDGGALDLRPGDPVWP